MEDIQLENLNVQKLKLRAGEHIDRDTILNLRGTKALVLENMLNTDEEYNSRESWSDVVATAQSRDISRVNVTTWSSLVRHAIDLLRQDINMTKAIVNSEEFRATFKSCLKDICDEIDLKLNSNCPKELYTEAQETDLIKSSVYMSNKNHFIPIIEDEEGITWGLCAVYTGEIIVMLEALLDTIHYMITEYRPDIKDRHVYNTMILTYINREDIIDVQNRALAEDVDEIRSEVSGIDEEIQRLSMAKDLILLQSKVSKLSTALLEIYADINEIQDKYNLPTADEILNNK